jgi:hypothetical protein
MGQAYKVPISSTHLEPAISLFTRHDLTVTDDIFEGVASRPVSLPPPIISFHGVGFSKVVPRTQKLDGNSMRMMAVTNLVTTFTKKKISVTHSMKVTRVVLSMKGIATESTA